MKKKCTFQFEKIHFFCYSFLAGPLALHFKDNLQSLKRCSYNILNRSKWRRIEKDLLKCLVIGKQLLMGQFTLLSTKEGWLFVSLKSPKPLHLLLCSWYYWKAFDVHCCSCCCRCVCAHVWKLGSLFFFRVFFPMSLFSSSSSCTHSSIVINIRKGPVFYFKIGKKARDLLLKDYTYDHKFLIATTTQSGLVSQTDKHPKSYFHLRLKFKVQGYVSQCI